MTKDWGVIDSEGLKASFLSDAQSQQKYFYEAALQHLRFYFPLEYRKNSAGGELADKIHAYEIGLNKTANHGR